MNGNNGRRDSGAMDEDEDEDKLLDSGLYCDFAPRPGRDEEEQESSENGAKETNEQVGLGGAFRRGTSNILNKFIGGKRGSDLAGPKERRLSDDPMETESVNADTATATTTTTAVKTAKPRRRRGSHMMPEGGMGAKPMQTESIDSEPAKATTVKAAKPRRRRGSHMMPEGASGGGQPMPTSAELAKAQEPSPVANAATAAKSSKPRRRRGSHMMPEGAGGGQTMPTSAELSKAQEPNPIANTSTTAKPSKPRRRRGSDMMPEAKMTGVTAASLKAGGNSSQANNVPADPLDAYTGSVSPATGQMQTLTVASSQTDSMAQSRPVEMSTASQTNSMYSEPPQADAPTPGRTRMRRRGSVVKTMIESGPKNVDGDGQYIAKASSTLNAADYPEEPTDNTFLPQRRSSEEAGGDNKRPMLGMRRASDNALGDGTPPGGMGKRGARKKRDIGRKAIRAMAADMDYVHKVVPKSNEAKELIYDAIKPNILFRACSPEELVDLVDAFKPQYVPKGAVVIQEGDEGDHFYVMERGGVDILVKDVHKVSLYSGVAFGEVALLYSCPRTATVLAKYDCKLWVIDRRAFRGITAQHKKRRLELKTEFLKKVKIDDKALGEMLKPSEIQSMALATKIETFEAGETIVRQGERGDAFYIVEDGMVDVYIKEKGDRPIVTLKQGSFFGEKALLSSAVRTATCVASTDVKCMLLMREDFVLMLGNLQDLLDRSYIARDEAQKAEHEAALQKESQPRTQRFDMRDFEIKRTLGVGAFGFVKLVKWKLAPAGDSDSYYALKCVSKQKIIENKQQEKIKREEDIMKALIHPFIARCYSVMEDDRGKYFLMEALCGGELCELLYHETQFSEEWSMFYSASVLSAFEHMHKRKIAYRDLKPENLVLDTAGYVKIVDFGLAKVINHGQTYTFCGTPDYLAPEVILNEGYDWAVDYWGLGVLIYEMTAGVAPFYAETPMETYEKVLSGHVHVPAHFSHPAANLIKKLLHPSQSKRIGRTVGGATTVMCHPWYTAFDWDALMDYRLPVPHVPDARHPDDTSSSIDEDEMEGFATAFF